MGQGGQGRDPLVGQRGQGGELVTGEQPPLVEEGGLGRGQEGPGGGRVDSGDARGSAGRAPRPGAERVTVVRMGVAVVSPGMPLR